MKKMIRKISIFILSFAIVVLLAACNKEGETIITGTIDRPNDLPPLGEVLNVKYPEKPSGMTAGQGSGVPTIGTATSDSEYYSLSQENGQITVSYSEVERWDYVYLPIENFNKGYQNIKITASATNVDKIAVAAIYYEMYDLGYPAVATLTQDVIDGAQYFVMQLGKKNLLDDAYNSLDAVLGDQTVIGLCIFIDSNPAQPTIKDGSKECVLTIEKVEFLPDGDAGLGDIYVAPGIKPGFSDPHNTVEKDASGNYVVTRTSDATLNEAAYFAISNYNSDYTAFTLTMNTTNVKNIVFEVIFSGGKVGTEWRDQVTLDTFANLSDGQHNIVVDFAEAQPTDMSWNAVPNYFVKNYNIHTIKMYIDTTSEYINGIDSDATIEISEFKFIRTAHDENTVTKKWAPVSSPVFRFGDDLNNGGIGSVIYTHHNSWDSFQMPISNYTPVDKITIKLQTSEPMKHIGIALVSGNYDTTNSEYVIKGSEYLITDTQEQAGDLAGLVQTVNYDSATNTYTITFDFSNVVTVDRFGNKKITEMRVSALRFYLTDPNNDDAFDGERTITFLGVTLG